TGVQTCALPIFDVEEDEGAAGSSGEGVLHVPALAGVLDLVRLERGDQAVRAQLVLVAVEGEADEDDVGAHDDVVVVVAEVAAAEDDGEAEGGEERAEGALAEGGHGRSGRCEVPVEPPARAPG